MDTEYWGMILLELGEDLADEDVDDEEDSYNGIGL